MFSTQNFQRQGKSHVGDAEIYYYKQPQWNMKSVLTLMGDAQEFSSADPMSPVHPPPPTAT